MTRVNPEILKKIFEVLIFHIKKLRNDPFEYQSQFILLLKLKGQMSNKSLLLLPQV
jgi:hypothetical protein